MKKIVTGFVGAAWPKQAAEHIDRKSKDASKLTVSFPLPAIWKERAISGQVKVRITIETLEEVLVCGCIDMCEPVVSDVGKTCKRRKSIVKNPKGKYPFSDFMMRLDDDKEMQADISAEEKANSAGKD